MKRVLTVCMALAAVVCLGGAVRADLAWNQVDFTYLNGGAASYDKTGANVVVSGGAFYESIRSGGWLGTQLVGGDGQGPEVAGNFAMYCLLDYDLADQSILGWMMSHPNTLMAYEVRTRNVQIDFAPLSTPLTAEMSENMTLNAVGMPGVDYLKATYNELAPWGYTLMASIGEDVSVWMDIALDPTNYPGKVAMSVVIDGFSNAGWDAMLTQLGQNGFDATFLAGQLEGPSQVSPGSGLRIAAIPEPATMLLLGLGGLFCRRIKKA